MNPSEPALQNLIDRVERARRDAAPLCIRGGGTKDFYGEAPKGDVLDTRALTGTPSYEPTELVVTTRCGTPLAELEALLAEHGQCLPFEPPHYGPGATVGGMVSAALAGPSRARAGSVRDHVLGATLLNGKAEVLSFGGQVIKNVAGYDVSRLLVGALGTLGVVLEVSLKVLPMARANATLRFDFEQAEALAQLHEWGGLPLPLDASAWWAGNLLVRLSGAESAVTSAAMRLGGEAVDGEAAAPFWKGLREHTDDFFARGERAVESGAALWRLGLPQTAPALQLEGDTLVEWHGAQRWLVTALPAHEVRTAAAAAGGHATLFRARDKSAGAFMPLVPPLDRIHRELKKAFDPAGIFNPGRLYPGL
ncbi:MAG: glycolate oxidase subunit GlcE [Pseudomonadota bacterium]|nr:glycolate oxidase subunit GlcE [Pseudomonadota bacterium]